MADASVFVRAVSLEKIRKSFFIGDYGQRRLGSFEAGMKSRVVLECSVPGNSTPISMIVISKWKQYVGQDIVYAENNAISRFYLQFITVGLLTYSYVFSVLMTV